jgi:N-acetylglucosaminyldiphosphoundecaprenol N-acetyl-beta-D-mannosaminyltransferase
MNFNSEQLVSFLAVIAGTVFLWLAARFFLGSLSFSLGRGSYVGGFPQLGAVIAVAAAVGFTGIDLLRLCICMLAIILSGLICDLRKISRSVFMLCILIFFYLFFDSLVPDQIATLQVVAWCGLIFVSLKISSLVYEMPFILTATSSLASLVVLTGKDHAPESIAICWAILACTIVFMAYSSTGRRVLTGNAGLAVWSFLLGLLSFFESSGRLIWLGLLLPSMVVLFPLALVSFVLVASYLGNSLHKRHNRNFAWTLKREQLVVFTGLIFLCLNFLGILVDFKAPAYGYLALGLLLIAALTGFFRTFMRKPGEEFGSPSRVKVLNQEIDAVTPEDVLDKISDHISAAQKCDLLHIITADSLAILRSLEDDRFQTVMQRAELVIPDGAGIIWAADFLGNPLPARVPGIALVSQVCKLSSEKGFKLFFLGGKPGIAQKAVNKLCEDIPDLQIVGVEHGYFKGESAEEDAIMQKIAKSGADILFVALGVPRQEWFINRFRMLKHKAVAIGVGGSFDVISRTLPRAPEWMQRFAIEWLFRLWLEPFRFGRIAKIPAFVLQVLRYKWNEKNSG